MKSEDKNILDKFEKIAWLYTSGELPEEEMKYWENEIETNFHLKDFLKEMERVQNFYTESGLDDIDNDRFEKALKNAVDKKRSAFLSQFLDRMLSTKRKEISQTYKLAFGSLMVIFAVALLLFSNKPNPVKDIGNELFSWKNEKFSSTVSQIEDNIYLMKNSDLKKKIRQNIVSDPWENEVQLIRDRIDRMESEISKSNL